MSYILDALNKSERERTKQNEIPSLRRLPTAGLPDRPSNWVHLVLLIIISVAAAAGYYFAKSSMSSSTEADTSPVTQTHSAPQNTPVIAASQPQQQFGGAASRDTIIQPTHQSFSQSTPSQSQYTAPAAETSSSDAQFNNPAAPLITDLPWAVRNGIPDIDYSAHVFSDGGSGFVILNGAMRYNGYRVSRDLIVKEIIENGVILEYQGTQFTLPAMKSWTKH